MNNNKVSIFSEYKKQTYLIEVLKKNIREIESIFNKINSEEKDFGYLVLHIMAIATKHYSSIIRKTSGRILVKLDFEEWVDKITDNTKKDYINIVLNMIYEKFSDNRSEYMKEYYGKALFLFPEITYPFYYFIMDDLEKDLVNKKYNPLENIINDIIKETYGEKNNEFLEIIKITAGLLSKANVDNTKIKKQNIEIEKNNKDLEVVKAELEKSIESKNALINHHAHNWSHIVYPKTVKEVAEALYSEGKTEYANKLFKAYNSENILQHDLLLLKLRHASSKTEMRETFVNDVLLSSAKSGIGIKKIIEDSLDLVLFRIIMENVDTREVLDQVKENISLFNNIDILRKSYTDSFITKKTQCDSLIEWFNNNIYQFGVDINPLWEDVKIKPNSVAYTQLVEIFINLIHNSINYGVKSKEGFIKLEFNVEKYNGASYYTLVITNPVDYDSAFNEGTKMGLESIRNTLQILNSIDAQENGKILTIETKLNNENFFIAKLYFSEEIIVKRRDKR